MKRWNEDDEDNLFPDTGDEGDEMDEAELNAEYIRVLEQRGMIEAAKLGFLQKKINDNVLAKTINYLEKSWFWKFKSKKKKLDLIIDTYQMFKALVDIDSNQQEEEKSNDA